MYDISDRIKIFYAITLLALVFCMFFVGQDTCKLMFEHHDKIQPIRMGFYKVFGISAIIIVFLMLFPPTSDKASSGVAGCMCVGMVHPISAVFFLTLGPLMVSLGIGIRNHGQALYQANRNIIENPAMTWIAADFVTLILFGLVFTGMGVVGVVTCWDD